MKLHYLAPLFEPKSVLVYARDDDASSAAVLNAALSEAEFNGSITRIVPTSQSFASIANVEASTRPDLALIAVGESYTVKALTMPPRPEYGRPLFMTLQRTTSVS